MIIHDHGSQFPIIPISIDRSGSSTGSSNLFRNHRNYGGQLVIHHQRYTLDWPFPTRHNDPRQLNLQCEITLFYTIGHVEA